MRLRPGSVALTVLLASATALGSLSNDMYVPSLPAIARDLHAGAEQTQFTLSAFLVGFAIGQIVYGPLSDKLGRKPVLLAGFALFLLATVGCMLARSIEALVAARIAQSLGASGPIIIARAIVRDLYEGPRAGRELSVMASIMGISPILAPVAGGLLQVSFGWRSSFAVVAALGLLLAAACASLLPETIRARQSGPISFSSIGGSFALIWRHAPFRAYAAILAVCYAGLFAFISASSFLFQNVYGLGPITFSLAFALCSMSFVSGTMLATRLAPRRGLDATIGLGVACLAAGGLAQALAWLADPTSATALVVPEMVYMAGVGLSFPHLLAAAMTPFPERAGAASSLLGVIQMAFAALVGTVLGAFLGASAAPFVIATAASGLAAFLLYWSTRNAR
ncbi:MAG TPA: multidrug effflux MFS transporter, partial [Beijerinckiaceae bacterium]|nr:multidrug effflux MFS transporter [Beijerinckiaceae bacterium]